MRVQELAEVSRAETLPDSGPISGAAFSAETAAVVRAKELLAQRRATVNA